MWWCKRWLSLNRESAADRKSAGGHRVHLTTDAHSYCHHPHRPACAEQPPHRANAGHVDLRVSEKRALNLAGGGRGDHRDACGDCTVHASQRKSVAGRAGAVDALLHHVGSVRRTMTRFCAQGTQNY